MTAHPSQTFKRWHLFLASVLIAVPITLGGYYFFLSQQNSIREIVRQGVSAIPDSLEATAAHLRVHQLLDEQDEKAVGLTVRSNAAVIAAMCLSIYLMLVAGLAFYYRTRQKTIFQSLFEREKELREYHEEFKTILYSIGDGVICTDVHGNVKQMNHTAEELTGWAEAECVGKSLEDVFVIINERTRKTVENPVAVVLKTGSIAALANHTLLLSRDGREIPIADSGAPVRDEDGKIDGVVLVFRDKTDEHRAEQDIRESREISRQSEARLNRGEAVAKIGNWELHMDTGMMIASKGAKTIYGVQGEKWDLKEVQKYVLPEYREMMDVALRRLVNDGVPYDVEFRIRQHVTGEVLDIHSIAEYDRATQTLFGVLQDVTKRKKLELQLAQSQKLETLGTLAGGIAHDFNNLLAMILGSAELMQMHTSDNPELTKYVERIIEASEKGTSISRQLLIFSRPGQTVLQPISLSHTINELCEMLRHFLPKTIAVRTSIDVANGMVKGDGGQIHQALLNLAINAGDAMKQSGTLTIREFNVDGCDLAEKFGNAAHVPYVAVSVSDTGSGMDAVTQSRIFEPFFSTKERGKGTGLGLAIVTSIVNNHRGFIDVQSAPDKGTTFTLYFPSVQ